MTTPPENDTDMTTIDRQPGILERTLRWTADSLHPPDGDRTKVNTNQALIWGGIILAFLAICEAIRRQATGTSPRHFLSPFP